LGSRDYRQCSLDNRFRHRTSVSVLTELPYPGPKGFPYRDHRVRDGLALWRQRADLAYLAQAADRQQDVSRLLVSVKEPERMRGQQMVNDHCDEPLVDHPDDQQEHLLPRRIGPPGAKDVDDELLRCPLAFVPEPLDDVGGAEVFEERPVDEPVDVRPEMAQDEVALVELVDHCSRDWLGLGGGQAISLLEVRVELGHQISARDVVAGTSRPGLL